MLSARNVEPKAQKKVNEDLERVCGWCGKSMGVVQQKPGPQPLQEYNKLTGPRPKEFDYPNYTPSPKQPETCMDCGNTFSAGPEDVKCPKCRAKGSKKSK